MIDIEELRTALPLVIKMVDDKAAREFLQTCSNAIEQLQAAFDKARFDAHTSAHDVERLQAENAELRAAVSEWIPVSERLPEVGSCLVCGDLQGDGRKIAWAFFNSRGDWCDTSGYFHGAVTHWMPLPEVPNA